MTTYKGYDDKKFELINGEGGNIGMGDVVTMPRRPNEVGRVTHIEPPHKPSSTGHVTTIHGRYYAKVYGLKFVEVMDA